MEVPYWSATSATGGCFGDYLCILIASNRKAPTGIYLRRLIEYSFCPLYINRDPVAHCCAVESLEILLCHCNCIMYTKCLSMAFTGFFSEKRFFYLSILMIITGAYCISMDFPVKFVRRRFYLVPSLAAAPFLLLCSLYVYHK